MPTGSMLILACLFAGVAPSELDRAAVDLLRSRVVPAEPEAWETIPWRTDLLAARREALGARKPLFIWSMNGHPCGAT